MDPKTGRPIGAPPPYPMAVGDGSTAQIIPPTYGTAGPTTVIITGSMFGPDPVQMTCRYCNQNVYTKVSPVPGLMAWILSGALCVFGCWLGCCLIPFCVQDCLDVEHRCSHCNNLLGTYQRKF